MIIKNNSNKQIKLLTGDSLAPLAQKNINNNLTDQQREQITNLVSKNILKIIKKD